MARRPEASPEVRQRAAERQRQVLQLPIHGLSFDAIRKRIGGANSSAIRANPTKSGSVYGAVRRGRNSGNDARGKSDVARGENRGARA